MMIPSTPQLSVGKFNPSTPPPSAGKFNPQPSAGKFNPSTPSTPKVTIITVSFNSAQTIGDTLKSVAAQSYPHIEHIIVDGGSIDQTMKIVADYPHVAKSISEADDGIYFAMNKGLAMASGDVIGILNADDLYAHNEVISKVAALFVDLAVDASYADLVFVDKLDSSKIVRRWKSGDFDRNAMYNGWMPPHPTFFLRKSIYERYGMFNTSLHSAADYELMLRLLLRNEINPYYLPETIIRMRQGGKSTASINNRIKANLEDRKAWKINGLKPHFFTLILKPLSKIKQFLIYE